MEVKALTITYIPETNMYLLMADMYDGGIKFLLVPVDMYEKAVQDA